MAFYAARPVLMKPAANVPDGWQHDIAEDADFLGAIREDLEVLQRSATSNSLVLERNGRWLAAAMCVAAGSVVLATLGWMAVSMIGGRC